ncbi:TolB family protein [Pseudonocardia adelaidensis]|uniref:WD40 repeat protein n=1 Tax=Pseudonocardia adelaidensis TaxID=648754 RepID=A0ABP9NPC8_9PSEU
MQPADIGRVVTVADPRVSPDGRRVAFVVTRVDLEGNRYRSSVWLAAADGSSAPFPLTAGDQDGQPAWSPDGRRLAFTRRGADGRSSLHVLPVDGPGETVAVCVRPEAIGRPAWSPDGSRLAFASRERASRYSEGDDDLARPPRRIDRLYSRLDDVGWIIDRPRSVFVVPADGSGEATLVAGGPYEHGDPAWSPDGRTLAVTAARSKDWDLELIDDVHLIDVDGGVRAHRPRAVPQPARVQPGRHADRRGRPGQPDSPLPRAGRGARRADR